MNQKTLFLLAVMGIGALLGPLKVMAEAISINPGISATIPQLSQTIAIAHSDYPLSSPATYLTLPQPPTASPIKTARPKRVFVASAYDSLFEKYGSQFNVPQDTLKRIAYCESRFNENALSKSQTYGGLYQFSASTWASTRSSMGLDPNPELRFVAEEAIMTAAYKIGAGGIRAWPVCGRS